MAEKPTQNTGSQSAAAPGSANLWRIGKYSGKKNAPILEGTYEIATAPMWRALGMVAAHNAIVDRLEARIADLQERLSLCKECSNNDAHHRSQDSPNG